MENVIPRWVFGVILGDTKKGRNNGLSLMWGRVDSNHRTDSRTDLQSVAIATMRLPHDVKRTITSFTAAKIRLFSKFDLF